MNEVEGTMLLPCYLVVERGPPSMLGEVLLQLCESRLDNLVYKSHLD